MEANPVTLVALFALIGGVFTTVAATVSPMLLSWMNSRQSRDKEARDYARQDLVAEKAAESARELLASNLAIAKSAEITIGKLDVVHALVNSNYTAALQSELEATLRELAMMTEVIDLKRSAGAAPTHEAQAAIATTEKRINELRTTLEDRRHQAEAAEAVAKQSLSSGSITPDRSA